MVFVFHKLLSLYFLQRSICTYYFSLSLYLVVVLLFYYNQVALYFLVHKSCTSLNYIVSTAQFQVVYFSFFVKLVTHVNKYPEVSVILLILNIQPGEIVTVTRVKKARFVGADAKMILAPGIPIDLHPPGV